MYEFKFNNPQILESCNMLNSWCVSNEMYVSENGCEDEVLSYYAIRCSKIELKMKNKVYSVGLDY